jgi:hypothetical protein
VGVVLALHGLHSVVGENEFSYEWCKQEAGRKSALSDSNNPSVRTEE